ncbi:tRNA-dihydrouridine(20) synthase [NAD(P)+] [[Candida] anglica]
MTFSSLYSGKLVLAPMVRSGEIPTRLMALKYGADLVWSPEIVDKKLIKCERVVNEPLGTIDYLEKGGNTKFPGKSNLVFRTLPRKEKGKLIFQLGTANPELAVKAAKIVAGDVDGIDLNAGCPKPFSTHSGMGAALLSTPDLLESILKELVTNVGDSYKIPISVKIRLLDDKDSKPTVDLVHRLCKTGISNLTLHCRTRDMRNRQSPIRTFLPDIIEACRSHKVNFIINGALRNRVEFEEFQNTYGEDIGGMIAEGAECNPTCFSHKPLPWNQVIPEFISIAQSVDNYPGNTKYILLNQLPGKSPFYQKFAQCKSHEQLMEISNTVGEVGNKVLQKYLTKDVLLNPEQEQTDEPKKSSPESKRGTEHLDSFPQKKQKLEATQVA